MGRGATAPMVARSARYWACLKESRLGLTLDANAGASSDRGLVFLDQFFDPASIAFPVTVARQGIGPARRLDQHISPDQASLDMNRRNLREVDGDLVDSEPPAFAPDDRLVGDLDDGWKEEIAFGPAAGLKALGIHNREDT